MVQTRTELELQEPPASKTFIMVVGGSGVALTVLAFALGLATGAPRQGFEPHSLDGFRALLCVGGLLLAGCAISLRPNWFGGWLCGAATGALGYGVGGWAPAGKEWYLAPPRDWYAALPNSWDSVQLFFGVAAVICVVGAIATRLPRRVLLTGAVLAMAFHFAGILSAITSPPPTPWLTDQYWKRVSRTYLQFAYMNNAYQFYSPDPGPACELWACFEYENPDKKDCEWIYVPKRHIHYVDPMGTSYYRRLSVTENMSQYHGPGYQPMAVEHDKITARRNFAARDNYLPRVSGMPDEQQHRVPNEIVQRQILPSYARHLTAMHANPDKKVKSVRIYRTLHLITTLQQFRGYDPSWGDPLPSLDPYNHSLYLPYFQGEYDSTGKLLDPTEAMLFWLVPILQDRPMPATYDEYIKAGGFEAHYLDYVAKHAGCKRPVEGHEKKSK